MCRFHDGDRPVMKFKSNGVGQLRTLRRMARDALSPAGGTVARRTSAFSGVDVDTTGPKAKTFPPLAKANWSFFVEPMLGEIFGVGSFRLNPTPFTIKMPPVPLPS